MTVTPLVTLRGALPPLLRLLLVQVLVDGAPTPHRAAGEPRSFADAAPLRSDAVASSINTAVVRIEVAAVSPSYLRAWEKNPQARMLGSGFVVEGRHILTNYHVIEDAVDIRLRKNGVSHRWSARVVAANPHTDLALLEVSEDGDDFFRDVVPVTWNDSLPPLGAKVSVRGYPTGGSTLCVTEGVVSRVDCKNYRLGVTADLKPGNFVVLQIDAAINGGNSGGPCFDASGRVVGVAFQGIDRAQSIGYIIPSQVARMFLASFAAAATAGHRTDMFHGAFTGVQEVPFRIHFLENKSLRRFLLVPPHVTGVVVTAVSPISAFAPNSTHLSAAHAASSAPAVAAAVVVAPAAVRDGTAWRPDATAAIAHAVEAAAPPPPSAHVPALLRDDVIIAIDGHAVGDDFTVRLRGDELLHADFLITSKLPGVSTTLEVLRRGRPLTLTAVLAPLVPPIPRNHGFDCQPR